MRPYLSLPFRYGPSLPVFVGTPAKPRMFPAARPTISYWSGLNLSRNVIGQVRVDHYRTTENRKVAFGTEPVDQILSADFNDSGPLQALFYSLQELQESAPALC